MHLTLEVETGGHQTQHFNFTARAARAAYLFPNQEKTALLFLFQITFPNNKNLNRLTEASKNLPYNCSYETIAEAPALYLRIIVPAFE